MLCLVQGNTGHVTAEQIKAFASAVITWKPHTEELEEVVEVVQREMENPTKIGFPKIKLDDFDNIFENTGMDKIFCLDLK